MCAYNFVFDTYMYMCSNIYQLFHVHICFRLRRLRFPSLSVLCRYCHFHFDAYPVAQARCQRLSLFSQLTFPFIHYNHILYFFVLYNMIKNLYFCILIVFISTFPADILSRICSFVRIHVLSMVCGGFFRRTTFHRFP